MPTLNELRAWFQGDNSVDDVSKDDVPKKKKTEDNDEKDTFKKIFQSDDGEEILDEIFKETEPEPEGLIGSSTTWLASDISKKETGISKSKMKKKVKTLWNVNYSIETDGKDALLLFGKHKGSLLTDIVEDNSGYLTWMLDQPFPSDLLEVVEYVLEDDESKAEDDIEEY